MTKHPLFEFKRLASVVVTILLLVVLLAQVDLGTVLKEIASVPVEAGMFVLALSFLNLGLVSFRLKRLLGGLGLDLPIWEVFRANIVGLASGLVMLPIVGTILGRHAVLRHRGMTASVNALSTAYERFVLVAVSGSFFTLGGLIVFDKKVLWDTVTDFPLAALGIALLFSGVVGFGLSRSRHEVRLLKSVFSAQVLRKFSELSLITVFGQLSIFTAYVLAMRSFGTDATFVELFAGAAIVSFVASLPISVNGWGVRELASVYVFGVLGIPAQEAVAVSVVIGISATLVVLLSLPLALRRDSGSEVPEQETGTALTNGTGDPRAFPRDLSKILLKAMCLALPLMIGALLFFQITITWESALLTVNLADPIAILVLVLIGLIAVTETGRTINVPRFFWVWLGLVSLVLVFGFFLGVSRFGVTSWALNNRIFGWFVLLGYFLAGAAIVGAWGRHGLRRLGEVILATAACVTVVNMGMQASHHVFGIETLIDENFQGFSGNRNSFAFQLIMAACFAIVFMKARVKASAAVGWSILTALVFYGLWQAQSRTGLVVMAGVLVFYLSARVLSFTALIKIAIGFVVVFSSVHVIGGLLAPVLENAEQFDRLARVPEHYNPESLMERMNSVLWGLDLWFQYPVFGAGLGAFIHSMLETTGEPLVIHWTLGWLLAEFGLFGTLPLIGLPVFGAYQCVRHFPRLRQSRYLNWALLAGVCLAFAMFSLAHEIAYQRILWLVLGAGVSAKAMDLVRRSRREMLPDERKIIHVIASLNRGGAETMLLGLMRNSRDPSRHCVVSLLSGGALLEEFRKTGVRVICLNFLPSIPNPIGILRLVREIRSMKPDLVQGWMYHGDLIGLVALYLSGRRDQTYLAWGVRCSDMDLSKYSIVLRMVVRLCIWLSALPDMVIANSQAGRSVHQALGYKVKRFEVVPNGIDTDRFTPLPDLRQSLREEMGIPPTARVAISVARVDPMKDQIRLIQAVEPLEAVWLVFVGKNTEQLPKKARVITLGQRGDIDRVLNVADAIVSSSAFGEGFSNALVEGMATGLVPITTDVGDGRMIAEPVGWVVPPSHTDALRDALRAFMTVSNQDLLEMQNRSQTHVLDNFTLARAQEHFDQVYDAMENRAVDRSPEDAIKNIKSTEGAKT